MDLLNTKINLIKYLDKVKQLNYIEDKVIKYNRELSLRNSHLLTPLKLNIVIHFSIMADIAGEFAEMIVNEPEEARDFLLALIVVCIKVLTDWDIKSNMIQLSLAIDSLPNVPNLKYFQSVAKGLVNIQGVLISRSTPSKYLISSVYKCDEESCPGYKTGRISVKESINKCVYCGKDKIEITKGRIFSDHVLGLFMPIDFLDCRRTFTRCQGIVIDFEDDLNSNLELGIQYNVIAKKEQKHFSGWGVEPMLPESLVRIIKRYPPTPYSKSIVEIINSVREFCGSSPWSLVTFLASQIAIDHYPVSSFMQLKTGLLLSLASTQCRKCPTSVLALGECASIMSGAARLSPRSLLVTSSLWTPPSGIVVSLDGESAWLEAGPLLLPSYGVLCIGNLPKSGSKFLSQITAAVDSELVTLQQKPGSYSVDPKILTYPLKSAVWTHWKCNQYLWQDMHHLRTLIDVFGMPFLSEIGCDDETLSSCVINNATGETCYQRQRIIRENDFREVRISLNKFTIIFSVPMAISNKDLWEGRGTPSEVFRIPLNFLGIISSQEVEMSEDASSLIKNYFVASRRERPDSLPIKAVKVLTAMCEAHARLSFRNVATYQDAVASIFLYEESVVTLFGKSTILEAPKRCCNSNNSYELSKQMDSTLTRFSDWLESYINALNINGLVQ